jgi:cytochrome oxidase assembly protein ShyY1
MMRQMFTPIRKHTLSLLLLVSLCSGAMAQDEDAARPDARLEGYQVSATEVGRVMIEKPGSYALTWFILAGLGVLGLGVMFKSGKRTHLD